MDLLMTGIAVGVLGTIMMDLLNAVFARVGLIQRIDIPMIGRMSRGWTRGRFFYDSPDQVEPVSGELALGYLSHYLIGVGLATPFVVCWNVLAAGPISPAWILVYGIATTVASVLFVYPSLGLGFFGLRSPDGLKAPLSSLANHTFFGAGMAVAVLIF